MSRLAVAVVVVMLLAPAARADDRVVLEAAAQAGYADATVLTRGKLYILVDTPADTAKPTRLLAASPSGSPVVELETMATGVEAATVRPFLRSKDVFDVDVTVGAGPGYGEYPYHRHYIVRARSLHVACELAGNSDSGESLKDQRQITKVAFKRVGGKPLVFKVVVVARGHRQGVKFRDGSTTKYEIGETGTCVEKK